MRGLALVLLVACSSSVAAPAPRPPATYDEARRQLVAAQCDRKVRCGEIGAADRATCLADPDDAKTLGYGPDWQRRTTDAIADGRRRYEAARFADCLAAVAGPCLTTVDRAPAMRCKLLAPNVKPGGACTAWEDCIDGFCTAQIGCTGHCVGRNPIGGKCGSNLLCVETAFCAQGTCTARKPVHEKCREWDSCQPGLQCIGYGMIREEPGAPEEEQLGTCTAAGAVGARCRPENRADCASGLACDYATRMCIARPERGKPCGSPESCAEGLVCAGLEAMWLPNVMQWRVGTPGTCVPPLDVGAPCDVFANPYATGCPGSAVCDVKTATCVHAAQAGSACEPNGGCRGNLYCHPKTKTCVAQLAFGAACTPPGDDPRVADDPCSLGKCDPKRRVCVPLQACGKP